MTALALTLVLPATLKVGPNEPYARIEDAIAAAQAGDTISVYPGGDYARTAIKLAKSNLTIKAVSPSRIVLDGTGFDYSGSGPVPRAIVQFDPTSFGSSLEGFELTGAHNGSHNGAGARINGASNISIRNCRIEGCDMGIMSNGSTASNQLIESCLIRDNGNSQDPGYNHNLYLSGASATVRWCNISGALTGHDLKSRLHYLVVQGCFLQDASNRELDLVDGEDTMPPNSNAVLIDNLVLKSSTPGGNGNTIHFGKEQGQHNGTIFLIGNTIVTPSIAPVLMLTSDKSGAEIVSNVVVSVNQANPSFVAAPAKARVVGTANWISPAYELGPLDLLRMPNQPDLPRDFFTTYRMSGSQRSVTYRDGAGNVLSVITGLGFSGRKRWPED